MHTDPVDVDRARFGWGCDRRLPMKLRHPEFKHPQTASCGIPEGPTRSFSDFGPELVVYNSVETTSVVAALAWPFSAALGDRSCALMRILVGSSARIGSQLGSDVERQRIWE